MKLPNFIIIGAAKAGTTSMYGLLNLHPDIFMPRMKEPEFFARDELFAEGPEKYARHFEDARPDQVVGEASTIYSLSPFFPDTAKRIRELLPETKIIYVMRQPVSRAYSFYLQLIKNYQNGTGDNSVHRSFEEFVLPELHAHAAPAEKVFGPFNRHLPDDPELCLAGSDYLRQINAYTKHFPRSQMLFLTFEAFRADRTAVMRQITDFIGVKPLPDSVFSAPSGTQNISRTYFDKRGQSLQVEALRRKMGPLWALKALLPERLRRRLRTHAAAGAPVATAHEPAPMLPETFATLESRFSADRTELERLTGLDLSIWGGSPVVL